MSMMDDVCRTCGGNFLTPYRDCECGLNNSDPYESDPYEGALLKKDLEYELDIEIYEDDNVMWMNIGVLVISLILTAIFIFVLM